MNELDLAKVINEVVEPERTQANIDVGTFTAIFIHHLLGEMQMKLYKLHDFFQDKAIALLFPWKPDLNIYDINDDRAGRVLDAIWDANPQKVFAAVAMAAIRVHSLETDEVHFDTTSKSFYGAYENQSEGGGVPQIARGYPKDHRPDLLQIILAAGTSKDGVPVVGDVTDGNASDMTTNGRWIKKLKSSLQKKKKDPLLLIADSALVTTTNLQLIKENKIDIISRLPGRFNLEIELKREALSKESWTPIGKLSEEKSAASYKAWDTTGKIEGVSYRFVVVHSDHKNKRKLKALKKAVKREHTQATKALKKLKKRPFACAKDAEIEVKEYLKAHPLHYHTINWEVEVREEREKRKKRGRPKKGEVIPIHTVHYLSGELALDTESYSIAHECCGLFVLITTLLDVVKDPCTTILVRYKGQGNVERIFRFIKDPAWLGAFCLKKPERIAALGYVLLLAALIYVLWERRVRRALSAPDAVPIEGLNRRKTTRPTTYALQSVMSPILVQSERTEDMYRVWLPRSLTKNQLHVLELSGFSEGIYQGVLPLK